MNISHKKLALSIIVIFLFIILFAVYVLVANKALSLREFEISSSKIPAAFNGFRILHISDLHNESFGKDNEKLIKKIRAAEPDIIALTGDIIDSRKTEISVAEHFIGEAVKIAPVYYVTGNHEPRIDASAELYSSMTAQGVKILRSERLTIKKDDGKITLYGIDDPSFAADYLFGDEDAVITSSLERLGKGDDFSILLSHRPEFFRIYCEYGFDLVLSGHAHGGQFRLPFVGGLFAPGQGFFPEYDSGLYSNEDTSMIVSRGLGNSVIPLRLFNRPEIITITLKEEK